MARSIMLLTMRLVEMITFFIINDWLEYCLFNLFYSCLLHKNRNIKYNVGGNIIYLTGAFCSMNKKLNYIGDSHKNGWNFLVIKSPYQPIRFFLPPFISRWNTLLIGNPVVSGHLVVVLSASLHSLKRKLLKADCEGTWKARMKGGIGEVLSYLTGCLSVC